MDPAVALRARFRRSWRGAAGLGIGTGGDADHPLRRSGRRGANDGRETSLSRAGSPTSGFVPGPLGLFRTRLFGVAAEEQRGPPTVVDVPYTDLVPAAREANLALLRSLQ